MWQKLEYLGMTITKIIFMMKSREEYIQEMFNIILFKNHYHPSAFQNTKDL